MIYFAMALRVLRAAIVDSPTAGYTDRSTGAR